MKTSGVCPKGQDTYVAPLPVAVRKKTKPGLVFGTNELVFGTNETLQEIGTFRSFTCAACSYTELYAENFAALTVGIPHTPQ